MKAGSFNIHDYLGKLYENVNEEDLPKLNEEKAETETGKPDEGLLQQGGDNKAYDWLKKEFQKGKTEVKVEMSSHTFKPGYQLQDPPKSTKDFPGMYSDVKNDTTNQPESTAAKFPETKFPGMGGEENSAGDSDTKTKADLENKTDNKSESSEGGEEKEEKKESGIKVEAKTKEDSEEKKEDKEEKDDDKKKDKKEE